MKTLVLMDDSACNEPWLREILRQQESQTGDVTDSSLDCDAVLVVNQGTTGDVDRLQGALRLRRSRPSLPIAVITPIAADSSEPEACTDGLRGNSNVIPLEQFRHLTRDNYREEVRVAVNSDAVMFEYGD